MIPILLILLASATYANDEITMQLSGRAHYAGDGAPAEGLTVLMFDLGNLARALSTTTDTEGRFRFALGPGAGAANAEAPAITSSFRLRQNYPNPFNPTTVIPYELARPAHVRLEVYNLLGQGVRSLVDQVCEAGHHQALWHARDNQGRRVAAGVYVYRIIADGVSESRSMVLVDGPAAASPSPGSGSGPARGGTSRTLTSRPSAPSPGRSTMAFRESSGEALLGGSAAVSPGSAISAPEGTDSPLPTPGVYGLTVSGPGVVMHVEPELRFDAEAPSLSIQVERAADVASAKPAATPRFGDVNNDGAVDIVDALIIATYGVNPEVIVPNNGDITLGDVNADERINIVDALMVGTYAIVPYSPALPSAIARKQGIVVNATLLDRDGIRQLNITPGDTVALAAASHPAANPPAFAWTSDTPSIVSLQTDPDDGSTAYAVALGDSGQTAQVTVEDRANQYERTFPVHIGPGPLAVQLPGGAVMEFAWIEPGEFMMGLSEREEQTLRTDGIWRDYMTRSQPARKVTISQGFYLGKYEITQAQWESVMETTPWSGEDDVQADPNRPAVYISWHDVREFVQRLNQDAEGYSYRLPTEAEWEYACRAGTTTLWSFGEDWTQLREYAWYQDNAYDVGLQHGQPVGTKLPNPWGLYDMYGNANEWCQDWWGGYTSGGPIDPTGPAWAWGSERVTRGGSMGISVKGSFSANLGGWMPSNRSSRVGARLVKTP